MKEEVLQLPESRKHGATETRRSPLGQYDGYTEGRNLAAEQRNYGNTEVCSIAADKRIHETTEASFAGICFAGFTETRNQGTTEAP